MFNNRDEDWSPFTTQRKLVERQSDRDPNGAVEIQPIVVMAQHNRAIARPVGKEEEAKAPAEEDPKVVHSSATNSAEDSGNDSSTTGSTQTQIQTPVHPSSLPPDEDNPVSAEKDQTPQALVFTPMNLG